MKKIVVYVFALLSLIILMLSGCDDERLYYSTNGKTGENIEWSLIDETLNISGTGAIPDFDFYGNGAKAPWYFLGDEIENIVVRDGITAVGDFAFAYLEAENVVLPESVTVIGDYAFFACEELESIDVPDGMVSIGDYAFSECFDLTDVYIPEYVSEIGYNAFFNCPSVTDFRVDKNNSSYSSENGVLFNADKSTVISYPSGHKAVDYTVPESVTDISDNAFAYSKNLKSVKLHGGIKHYGDGVFACSGIHAVKLPVGITSVTDRMFYGCENLSEFTVPAGVEKIGESAFSNCTSLKSIEFPTSLSHIGDLAFSECVQLESLVLPPAVKTVNYRVFSGCSGLENLELPIFLENIESYAFSYCTSLESLVISTGLENVDEFAFRGCSSLRNIEYEGTRAMWKNVRVEGGNDCFIDAVVSFPNDKKDN